MTCVKKHKLWSVQYFFYVCKTARSLLVKWPLFPHSAMPVANGLQREKGGGRGEIHEETTKRVCNLEPEDAISMMSQNFMT